MPRKAVARMLRSSISTSQRVNRLSLKAALVFTWMISHADDQGRLLGSAVTIKGLVVPLRRDITEDDIVNLLSEIEHENLIIIDMAPQYDEGALDKLEDEKEELDIKDQTLIIQFNDWRDYQKLKEIRPSRYPAPKGWEDTVMQQPRDDQGRFSRTKES